MVYIYRNTSKLTLHDKFATCTLTFSSIKRLQWDYGDAAAPRDIGVISDRCLDPLGRTTSRTTSNKNQSLGTPAADP